MGPRLLGGIEEARCIRHGVVQHARRMTLRTCALTLFSVRIDG